jgi:hypothetical protein
MHVPQRSHTARGDRLAVDPGDGVLRTASRGPQDAAIVMQHDFQVGRLAFRIVTPPATEWTTLEKDGGADARPIVDGIFFDIED